MIPARLLVKLDVGLCWTWQGCCLQSGYGRAYGGAAVGGPTVWLVHRLVWTLLVGPIPKGLTLDHLCKNRACCNPDHLDPVTLGENAKRGKGLEVALSRRVPPVACPARHRYTDFDWQARGAGRVRDCKECRRIRSREYQRRKRAEQGGTR